VWVVPMRKAIWRESRRNSDGIVTTGINIPKSEFLNEARTAVGLDIHTGEVTDELPFGHTQHHHRCYRNKATLRHLLIGHSGIQLVDLATKTYETNRWVRGICQYGIMPANGYIYVPPDTCRCYAQAKINGFYALSERNSMDDVEVTPVLEKGPAYDGIARGPTDERPETAPAKTGGAGRLDEWPTYRGDISRSGSTGSRVPARPSVEWQATVGRTVTAPVVAGNRVFVAERDAYAVYCLATNGGRTVWRFYANGPVDTPPTVYEGLCIFGCGDGSVYCLDAESGRLAWRFRTSMVERRIGYENRLASPLSIHGSVLVMGGTVYFAAGLSSNLDGGIRLYGLDARTGKQLYTTQLASGTWGDEEGWGCLADVLVSDGNAIVMRGLRFDATLSRPARGNTIIASTGFLDDSWFHRQEWKLAGGSKGSKGQLIAYGNNTCYAVSSPYTGLKGRRKGKYKEFNQDGHLHQKFTRYREEFFPVGTTISARPGKRVGAKQKQTGSVWSREETFQPRAMILAGDKLLLAGWPDAVTVRMKSGRPVDMANPDPHDSVLRVLSAETGEQISECKLEADPVFDGMAAGGGKLFVSLRNGKLVCLGE